MNKRKSGRINWSADKKHNTLISDKQANIQKITNVGVDKKRNIIWAIKLEANE